MIKVDFHVHTKYSKDSMLPLKSIKAVCLKKGILPCITDHNTIRGATLYRKRFGPCIVGEEINTLDGEISGLFLNEEIPKGLSVNETVELIKEQDGVVYVPHPFDFVRSNSVGKLDFNHDIVEVFNSRVLKQKFNRLALEKARELGKLMAAGSDAHTAHEVGNAHVVMDDYDSRKEFFKALAKAQLKCRRSAPYFHAFTAATKVLKKMF